jgi:hypothetical protein
MLMMESQYLVVKLLMMVDGAMERIIYAGAVVHMSMVHSPLSGWKYHVTVAHSRYTSLQQKWREIEVLIGVASLDGREVRTYSIDSYMATLKFENGLYSFLCACRRKT